MRVITQAIRVIDYENNEVLTRDIMPNFSEYIEQLIAYINIFQAKKETLVYDFYTYIFLACYT